MDDQQRDQPKVKRPRTAAAIAARRGAGPTAGSWRKGVSGNPAGRPRSPSAFAERVRERVDPDLVIELALRVATDESLAPAERLRELWPLVQQGWTKPPAGLAVHVDASVARRDWSALSDADMRELLARIRSVPLLAGADAGTQPSSLEDERP